MTSAEAVDRLNTILAHLWMIRTFLKHADDIQEDEELLEVPRLLYDSIRAVEPAFQRGDLADYLRRLKGKLPKLRKSAEFFAREFKRASVHTNFEMAAISYTGCVRQMEEIFAAIATTNVPVVDDGKPVDDAQT
jgi:hypothetical protein